MKNHLKRIPAPKTWSIDRKIRTFVVRPTHSGHPFNHGLPLGVIIRDCLKLTSTMREARKLLQTNEVLVDGFRRKEYGFQVGLFDIVTIKKLNKSYTVTFDRKGRLIVEEIPAKESEQKICKIIGKTVLPKGKIQYNLSDGKNIVSDKKIKIGDSLVLGLPKLDIKEVLELKPGAFVFLVKGKHQGSSGKLKEVKGEEAVYTADGEDIDTAKAYLFVVKEIKKQKTGAKPVEA
ncbi:30S ribosomal protein S4e [Candidatus Woesearchaeota archaeon]|nr:30S ribosomal protein S4e [Candidatus Woesearchaeota archaeon]